MMDAMKPSACVIGRAQKRGIDFAGRTGSTGAMKHALACGLAALTLLSSHGASAMVGGAKPVPDGPRAVVMIVGSGGTLCTGTAIARDLVLSAAHCAQPGSDYKILDFDAAHTPVLRDVKRVAVHPGFSMKTFLGHRATADVALLKLAQPLPAKFTTAALYMNPRRVAPGDRLTFEGYGVTVRGNPKTSGTLRSASLEVTGKPGTLQIRLVDPVGKGERPGLGGCTGDSGGPLFDDASGARKIIGVLSWSTGPKASAGCGGLTGITPLALYLKWITDTAGKMGSPVK
jgi:hypothetical protein